MYEWDLLVLRYLKHGIWFLGGRKHCGKGENVCYLEFLHDFPTTGSKAVIFMVVEIWDCMAKIVLESLFPIYLVLILVSPFSNNKFKTFRNWNSLQTANFKFDENGRKFSNRVESTKGKEKLLVTSNFSFSYGVF